MNLEMNFPAEPMLEMIYGRSGLTTPPAPVDAAPNPCSPNTHPAPNLPGPSSFRPNITKHKICTSIYQPGPVRPHYCCTRMSIRPGGPTFLYTYSWSGPMQLSMKFAHSFTVLPAMSLAAPLCCTRRSIRPHPLNLSIRQEHCLHNN